MSSKALNPKSDFKLLQARFTAYVKDPQGQTMLPGIKPERMAMYAELLFNNIESFLGSNFPVIKRILTDSAWLELVRDFYVQHSSRTPYFCEIPQEFLAYLQNERDCPDDYPFLLELAQYEWVEVALAISQDELVLNPLIDNLLPHSLLLSPLAWLLAYNYPVQQISPTFLPTAPPAQPTFLVVYRDQTDVVKFLALNPVTFRLLQLIQDQPNLQASYYLQQVIAELPPTNPDIVMAGGLEVLQELAEKNVITVNLLAK